MSAQHQPVVDYPAPVDFDEMALSDALKAELQAARELHITFLNAGKTFYFIPTLIGVVMHQNGLLRRGAQELRSVLCLQTY